MARSLPDDEKCPRPDMEPPKQEGAYFMRLVNGQTLNNSVPQIKILDALNVLMGYNEMSSMLPS